MPLNSHDFWTWLTPGLVAFGRGLLVFLVAQILLKVLIRLSIKGLGRRDKDPTAQRFATSTMRVLGQMAACALALAAMGVDTTAISAMLGAFSFAIGLSLKNLFANAASGFVIVLFGHYSVGSRVELGGVEGTVASIDLFDTLIQLPDRLVAVPNSKIVSDKQIIFQN